MKTIVFPAWLSDMIRSPTTVAIITIAVLGFIILVLWGMNAKFNQQTGYDRLGD
jgi:hypothetical protein